MISISQFARDNSVFFEFYSSFCVVKDMLTKKILLQGNAFKGLYKFGFVNSKNSDKVQNCSNLSKSTQSKHIFDLWHCKLGHPSVEILKNAFEKK